MNTQLGVWLAQLMATDAPALPSAWAMQLWLHLGWSVVLACAGASLVGRWMPGRAGRLDGRQWAVALVLAVWTWLPGPYAPAHWLGLAFQAPSVAAVLLCDALLRRRFFPSRPGPTNADGPSRVAMALAWAGVLLGWALVLDSFALLPVQLYAWGFSPAAVVLVLALALLPWAVGRWSRPVGPTRLWVVPIAVLVFAVWRLPSGNVWDAVLDPCLWLVLHWVVVRAAWARRTHRLASNGATVEV
ncbi:MAG: hypothetical protein V4858_08010 [Pseudomonadota bacterium]